MSPSKEISIIDEKRQQIQQEPVQFLGRNHVCLNGLWRFQPNAGSDKIPSTNWGKALVPGVWHIDGQWPWWNYGGVMESEPEWQHVSFQELDSAWYQRELVLPTSSETDELYIGFKRISTRAWVYLDGHQIGSVTNKERELRIPDEFKNHPSLTLTLLVEAAHDGKPQVTVWDAGSYTIEERELKLKGLPDDVYVVARPREAHIQSIFIKPSYRNRSLDLEVSIDNLATSSPGTVELIVSEADTGKVALRNSLLVEIKDCIAVSVPWENPKLWGIGEANLYVIRVTVETDEFKDCVRERFGFRELWIDGRDFYLNGKKTRFRPAMAPHVETSGNPAAIRKWMASLYAQNYNLLELWPQDATVIGNPDGKPEWLDCADEMGMPLMFPLLDARTFLFDSFIHDEPVDEAAYAEWESCMQQDWETIRNHPSAVIWIILYNSLGHADDQNPTRLGNRQRLEAYSDYKERFRSQFGQRIVDTVREMDASRPVTSHQNGSIGDIHTMNQYLGFHPLQEREDWLSAWAESGDLPYLSVEFGIPFAMSLGRNRQEYGVARNSECWMTEYAAIYQGAEAYALEQESYRSNLVEWQNDLTQSFDEPPGIHFEPAFQQLCQLFVKHTWRSWRTYGLSGGLIPWTEGYAWDYTGIKETARETLEIEDGKWGNQAVSNDPCDSLGPDEGGARLTMAGKALKDNNEPVLVWIAGPEEAFTRKDHIFQRTETIQKSIVIINDSGKEQAYTAKAFLKTSSPVSSLLIHESKNTIQTGFHAFLPLSIPADEIEYAGIAEIHAEVEIDGKVHKDILELKIVVEATSTGRSQVMIHDPEGDSRSMLTGLGYQLVELNPEDTEGTIVIGRNALSKGKLPFDAEVFVRNGGHLVVLSQDPATLEKAGFRIAKTVSRKMHPLSGRHEPPVVDPCHLHDWRGQGSLVEEVNVTADDEHYVTYPPYGWHWGNRGSVCSAPIEKPHFSGWQARIEGEFDLAYSGWLQLSMGKGAISLCTLDLERRGDEEPSVAKALEQVLQTPAAKTQLGRYTLDGNPCVWMPHVATSLSESTEASSASLLVVTKESQLDLDTLHRHLEAGGNALIVGVPEFLKAAGWVSENSYSIADSIADWDELEGISLSDTRTRLTVRVPLLGSSFPGELTAGNLIGKLNKGCGTAIFCMADESVLDVEANPYLRFSRWRWTRLACQIAANIGIEFKADHGFIEFLKGESPAAELYHPDTINEFINGDDPYRYYRW